MPAATKPKARVLVLHGAIDPFVPPTQVQGFLDEMNKASADYQFVEQRAWMPAFGITYRYAMWLQRPPTRMYWRRGFELTRIVPTRIAIYPNAGLPNA